MSVGDALARGREDIEFFSAHFLKRRLHSGQAEFIRNAQATINLAPTGNRWGKTTLVTVAHFHNCAYKIGGESRYFDADGELDVEAFLNLRYETAHCANLSETAGLVWQEANRITRESKEARFLLDPYPLPKSQPYNITFFHGARWRVRTLGDDGSGLDGTSFYFLSVDEAGWIKKLEQMVRNVLRVRVADVRGRIWLVGTMKPGALSADFYGYCQQAAAECEVDRPLEHRPGVGFRGERRFNVDPSLYRYADFYGIDLNDYLEQNLPRRVADRLRLR